MKDRAADVVSLSDERVLARARLLLATASFLAVYLDPTEPQRFVLLTYGLLLLYVAASASIAVLVETRRQLRALPVVAHVVDVVWIGAVTSVSGGTSSPLFAFATFALVAAAYRWGFFETIATSSVLAAVLLGQVLFLRLDPEVSFELNRFVVRTTYTILAGVLLAYLAAHARQLQRQSALTARLLTNIRSEMSLARALEKGARELLELFDAQGVILAVRPEALERTMVWTLSRNVNELTRLETVEPDPYFFPAPSAFALMRRGREIAVSAALDAGDDWAPVPPGPSNLPERFAYALVVAESVAGDWNARVFVLDPRPGARGPRGLRLLRDVVATAAPALHGVYLVGHVRSRARADERARLARDLHDTSIQSLIGLEMELRAFGRRIADPALRSELGTLESRVREEVRVLRRLMTRLGESSGAPRATTEQLSEELARFQIETRIRARLISPMAIVLPPRLGREVVRLVQAALSNVRRHSSASRVDVSVDRDDEAWLLVIEDDGVFDEGLRTAAPRTMRERVSALGGQLVVRQGTRSGVRVEIRLPLVAQ